MFEMRTNVQWKARGSESDDFKSISRESQDHDLSKWTSLLV